jgi:hypothetical protein
MILQGPNLFVSDVDNLLDIVGRIEGNMEFSRIVSKFLMRAKLAERGKETNTRSFFFFRRPCLSPPLCAPNRVCFFLHVRLIQ